MNLSNFASRVMIAGVIGITVTLHSGCLALAVGAAGGAGAVAYVRGELESTLPSGLDAAHRAANRALTDLQFAKINESKDALAGEIVARTALDKKISIRLDKISDTLTRVRIRVGTFGDEQISRALMDKIKANL